jgi:hypothetical protein
MTDLKLAELKRQLADVTAKAFSAAVAAGDMQIKLHACDIALTAANARIAELEAALANATNAALGYENWAPRFFEEKSEFYSGDHLTFEARKVSAISELFRIGDVTSIIINEGDWGVMQFIVREILHARAAISTYEQVKGK